MKQSWLGLGSNLDQPLTQVNKAMDMLEQTEAIRILRKSSCYRTPPWGDRQQDDFINSVLQIETSLEPLPLLHLLQSLEDVLGRRRSNRRWGPRLIDIDLLLYDGCSLRSPELEVPHPRIHERAFVLLPMSELDEALEIPGHGTVKTLLAQLDCSGIFRLSRDGGYAKTEQGG